MGSTDDAVARVDQLFARFEGHEVPIWSGDLRSVGSTQLDAARERALRATDDAGRTELLDTTLERIERAYAMRAADAGYWTGIYAVSPPWDSQSRALSQMVVEDLFIALIVEDLVPASVSERLRVDGEELLRIPATEPDADPSNRESHDDGADVDDDGEPPVEPFAGPLVFRTRWLAAGLLVLLLVGLLGGPTFGWEGLVALLLIGGAVLILRRLIER